VIGISQQLKRCLGGLALLWLSACGNSEERGYQPALATEGTPAVAEYVVGIHPLHNPQRLLEVYGPIVDYMNREMPEAHFKLEASHNYEEFERKLYRGHFDFAMPNPYQTVLSLKHGYRVFGKMGDDAMFRGIILVRKDSGIRRVADLKGRAVSYPAATALAATMLPQYFLHTHGLDVNRDLDNRYVGSQESSIMNVVRGHVAAGATWPVPWRAFVAGNPELAAQLQVQWETDSLPNNGWVVRSDVAAPVAEKFSRLLAGLQHHPEGQAMLARVPISCFEMATDETYRPVRDFLAEFSRRVRPIEQ
jgi:phosphonate transport system substrate-binding protein